MDAMDPELTDPSSSSAVVTDDHHQHLADVLRDHDDAEPQQQQQQQEHDEQQQHDGMMHHDEEEEEEDDDGGEFEIAQDQGHGLHDQTNAEDVDLDQAFASHQQQQQQQQQQSGLVDDTLPPHPSDVDAAELYAAAAAEAEAQQQQQQQQQQLQLQAAASSSGKGATANAAAGRGARGRSKSAQGAAAVESSPRASGTGPAVALTPAQLALEETERQLQKLNREAMPLPASVSAEAARRAVTHGTPGTLGSMPAGRGGGSASGSGASSRQQAQAPRNLQYAGGAAGLEQQQMAQQQQQQEDVAAAMDGGDDPHVASATSDLGAHMDEQHAQLDPNTAMQHDPYAEHLNANGGMGGEPALEALIPNDVRYGAGYAKFVEDFAVRQGLIERDQQSPMLAAWLSLTPQERDDYASVMSHHHLDYSSFTQTEEEEFQQREGEGAERFTVRLTQKASGMVRRVYETCHINYLLLCSPPFITPPDFPVLSMSPPAEFFWQGLRGGPATNLTKFLSLSHPAVTTRRLAIPFGARSLDVKSRLNAHMRKLVREASGIADAEMKWTRPESLIQSYGVKIVGWPHGSEDEEAIPLRNPSNNNAKQNRRLLELAESGELRIEQATAEDRAQVQAQIDAEQGGGKGGSAAARHVSEEIVEGVDEEHEEHEEDYDEEADGDDGTDGSGAKKRKRSKTGSRTAPRIKRPRVKPLLTLNPDGTIRHGGLEGRRRPGRPRNADRLAGETKAKKTPAPRKRNAANRKKKTSAEEDVDESEAQQQQHAMEDHDQDDVQMHHAHEEGDGMYLPETGDLNDANASAMALAGMMMDQGQGEEGVAHQLEAGASLNDAFHHAGQGADGDPNQALGMEQAMQYFHQHGAEYYQPDPHASQQVDPMLTRGEGGDPAAQAVAEMLMHQEEDLTERQE